MAKPTYNFWIFGDSFGLDNDLTEYYYSLKTKYPTIPNKQDIIGSAWVKIIAEAKGYVYDSQFNLSRHSKSTDWYLMRLYRMIHKGAIRPGDFVLITATAETRFEYSTDIEKSFDFNNPYNNDHLQSYHMMTSNQAFGQDDSVLNKAPGCLDTFMNLHQDLTWLAHLNLMKHEMVKGYLDNLGIDNMIIQSIGSRHDDLPENKLHWGQQPNPMLCIKDSIKEYNIDNEDSFKMYQAFRNHLDPKQNKIYANQLLEFFDDQ